MITKRVFNNQLRRPYDWTMAWTGTNMIYGWGHNHRGQLGGVEGPKVKIPQQCDSLSSLKPVQICGGEQSLFVVTAEGKVCFWTESHNLYILQFSHK